jgi:hypothetical protein
VFLFLAKLLYEIAFFSSKLNIERSTAPNVIPNSLEKALVIIEQDEALGQVIPIKLIK